MSNFVGTLWVTRKEYSLQVLLKPYYTRGFCSTLIRGRVGLKVPGQCKIYHGLRTIGNAYCRNFSLVNKLTSWIGFVLIYPGTGVKKLHIKIFICICISTYWTYYLKQIVETIFKLFNSMFVQIMIIWIKIILFLHKDVIHVVTGCENKTLHIIPVLIITFPPVSTPSKDPNTFSLTID